MLIIGIARWLIVIAGVVPVVRIQSRKCSDEGSILFSEMLTDFERIGDHALNIANEMLKMAIV